MNKDQIFVARTRRALMGAYLAQLTLHLARGRWLAAVNLTAGVALALVFCSTTLAGWEQAGKIRWVR